MRMLCLRGCCALWTRWWCALVEDMCGVALACVGTLKKKERSLLCVDVCAARRRYDYFKWWLLWLRIQMDGFKYIAVIYVRQRLQKRGRCRKCILGCVCLWYRCICTDRITVIHAEYLIFISIFLTLSKRVTDSSIWLIIASGNRFIGLLSGMLVLLRTFYFFWMQYYPKCFHM